LRSVMTGSGVTSGLVVAFSTAADGPAMAARHEPCAWRLCRRGRRSRQDGSMTTVRSGVPGHDDGTAFVRLRRGKLAGGMYGTKEGAEAALMDHIGMQTR